MALPFLAMGLGLLGGKAFLQSKEDARTADTTLRQAESWLANRPDWAAQNAGYLEQLENLRTNQGFFSDDAGLAQSYLQNMQADYEDQQALAQQQMDNEARRQQIAQTDRTGARSIYAPAEALRSATQRAIQNSEAALMDENMTGLDVHNANLAMIQALLPGEAVMEGDIAAVNAARRVDAQWGLLMEKWNLGEIDAETYRAEMIPILERINRTSLSQFNAAKAAATKRAGNIGTYDFSDVQGYQEGSLQYAPASYAPSVPVPTPTMTPEDAEAEANSRGRTLINPNQRSRTPGGDRRARRGN